MISRRLTARDEAIERLERSVQAYQDDRDRLAAAYRAAGFEPGPASRPDAGADETGRIRDRGRRALRRRQLVGFDPQVLCPEEDRRDDHWPSRLVPGPSWPLTDGRNGPHNPTIDRAYREFRGFHPTDRERKPDEDFHWALCAAILTLCPALAGAVEIRGDYVEARNADVFTGPCFSNAEVFIYGKQAVMAWKVNEGTWKGVDLAGLCVAAAVQGETTFSEDNPDKARAILIVDSRADERQRTALDRHGQDPGRTRLAHVVRVAIDPDAL